MTDSTHSHDHAHGGGHRHAPIAFGRAFAIGVALNLIYVATEAAFGVKANSLALIADAGHNFSDVLGLAVAWLAAWLGSVPPSQRYTYGLRGSSILAALGNAVILLIVTGGIGWEAIHRLLNPEPSAGATIIVVSAIGVVVNGATALLFASGRKDDLNIRGAFLHMASDALVSLGVVVAGGLILVTHWAWLDPAVSLAVGAVIVWGTWSLMRESLDLAVHAVPAGVDPAAVSRYLGALPGVTEVHDLHIWAMSTTETALTVHLVRPEAPLDDALLAETCRELRRRFSIHHATLQVEAGHEGHPCQLAPHGVV